MVKTCFTTAQQHMVPSLHLPTPSTQESSLPYLGQGSTAHLDQVQLQVPVSCTSITLLHKCAGSERQRTVGSSRRKALPFTSATSCIYKVKVCMHVLDRILYLLSPATNTFQEAQLHSKATGSPTYFSVSWWTGLLMLEENVLQRLQRMLIVSCAIFFSSS